MLLEFQLYICLIYSRTNASTPSAIYLICIFSPFIKLNFSSTIFLSSIYFANICRIFSIYFSLSANFYFMPFIKTSFYLTLISDLTLNYFYYFNCIFNESIYLYFPSNFISYCLCKFYISMPCFLIILRVSSSAAIR